MATTPSPSTASTRCAPIIKALPHALDDAVFFDDKRPAPARGALRTVSCLDELRQMAAKYGYDIRVWRRIPAGGAVDLFLHSAAVKEQDGAAKALVGRISTFLDIASATYFASSRRVRAQELTTIW